MNDLVRVLRGHRIDGRGTDEIMRLAADEIESLQSQLSYRIEERDDSNRNLTSALRREVASKDRLAAAEALLRLSQKSCGRELAESISAYFAPDSAPDAQEGT